MSCIHVQDAQLTKWFNPLHDDSFAQESWMVLLHMVYLAISIYLVVYLSIYVAMHNTFPYQMLTGQPPLMK